ncbi:MAG: hypothetical protein M1482_00195 [Chloroflexi bacterium]|nr:hypothetical protein [Chloroflexota bacterium]
MLSPDNKLILAHPILTYLALDERRREPLTASSAAIAAPAIPPLSSRRRQKENELASERIAQQKKDLSRGFAASILFAVFGALFVLLGLLRFLLISDDWLNLLAFGIGAVFIPVGAYLARWHWLTARSLIEDEEQVTREREQSVRE